MQPFVNHSVLRLLDANGNRTREGLRVLEDYARFVLDDRHLCELLKHLRHDLATATKSINQQAVLHRDTPGDVGTDLKTNGEMSRKQIADVVIAAGKRVGEGLRAIEEYLKIESITAAAAVEAIRYRFYDIEKRIALTLRPANRLADVRLYVLITESFCTIHWLKTAEAAIRGGAHCLQLREKNLPDSEWLDRAGKLVELCHRHGVLCIVNDRPVIACLSGADGVHLGQDDLPATQVRQLIGNERIIGVSTHCIEQARQAVLDGADYIGVGPIFPSSTKPRDFVAGLAYARQVAAEIKIPAIAIAGITYDNVQEVLATELRSVAVTNAVTGAADVQEAAQRLTDLLTPRDGAMGLTREMDVQQ